MSARKVWPLYWQTKYGSACERQTEPDSKGFATFRRLSDNALRDWHLSEMRPLSDSEVTAMVKAAIDAVQS